MKINTGKSSMRQAPVTRIVLLCMQGFSTLLVSISVAGQHPDQVARPPNILFCISDDQSYAHTGANGDPVVQTPAFDRVAREGLRFTHAFSVKMYKNGVEVVSSF